MKKLFVLSISVLLSANLFTIRANDPYLTRSFPAASIKAVEAATSNGNITVTGDASSEAVVEVFATNRNLSAEKIKQIVDENYSIDIKVEGGKLYAEAKQKIKIANWNQQGVNISFKISVPNRVNSNMSTSNGSIQISNLSGSQDLRTSNGSVKIENVSGKISGTTSNGSITVANSNDDVDLRTSNGSITVKDCNGKFIMKTSNGRVNVSNHSGAISATTSNGSVTASNMKGDLKIGTSNGSVNLNGVSGSVDAKTTNSSINVTMDSVDKYVKLSNSGKIDLTLPVGKGYNLKVRGNRVQATGLQGFSGKADNKSIDGTIGNGGAEIDIRTSQQVNLSFK